VSDTRPLHKYAVSRSGAGMAPHSPRVYRPVYYGRMRRRLALALWFRRAMLAVIAAGLLVLLVGFAYKFYVEREAARLTYGYDSADLPHNHVAMVFGAGLWNGKPSPILYDRVATAADLYHSGKVDKLLMTGDNSEVDYNEVEAMRKAAVQLGVADRDIVLDHAGFNTWDSCYRAREVFGLAEATLVTQRFHLPRALHACNYLGVKSVGVAADRQYYDTTDNEVREFPALLGNLFRIITNDQPRFLGPKVDINAVQER
jgi:vancomycin permeability regulator SanA